jgi:hypothetical protein
MVLLHLFVSIAAIGIGFQDPQPSPTVRPAECREWRQCRQLALDAYARGEYETFHDLAWRTVQTGPARDPISMFLLARAQSLSGRPHDALVMLGRLADMNVATDAATSDDFRPARALREWAELEARLPTGGAPLSSTNVPTAPGAPAAMPGRSAATSSLFKAEDALSLPAAALEPAGLAYDGVSGRFVVGDRRERKLVVLDERSHHAVDLVRASSAGFYEITGIEIDAKRGDLWVVSADPSAGDASPVTALNRLQLVSGRPIDMVSVTDRLKPARLDDVAVTSDGVVFVLDTLGKRLFRLDRRIRALTVVATLKLNGPTSIAPVDERTIYVAHESGLARVESSNGTVTEVRGPTEVPLGGFKRIRWGPSSLIGIQQMPDGGRRAVSVRLTGGRAVSIDVFESDMPIDNPTAATLSSGDFYFLTSRPQQDGKGTEVVVRRVRLR